MRKKTILLAVWLSLFGAWAGVQGAPAADNLQPTAPSRLADDIDIYQHMGGLKPLDQWSFTLEAEDLKLAVPAEAFGTLRDAQGHLFLRMSVQLMAHGQPLRTAPVTPLQRVALESRQITGPNPESYLFNSKPVQVDFSGKQVYSAIKAMETCYGDGVSTILVPELLRSEAAPEARGRRSKHKPPPPTTYAVVPTGTNQPSEISILALKTNRLEKVSSATTIEERDLALYVKQEAAAVAMEGLRSELEGRLASEAAARKAAEEKLTAVVDQQVKERQAAVQQIEAQVLALGRALSNFTQVDFKKFSEDSAFKFQWQAQAVSNLSTSANTLATNLALLEQRMKAIGAAVDKLNDRSGWGNIFKKSETTTFGQ